MHDILLFLVGVHAQVSGVARALLERAMHALIEDISNEAKASFAQVPRYGMGGMLRATLEIEFMHQVVSQYVTATASATLSELYTSISNAYKRPLGGEENLQAELDGVKRTLADTRRATSIDFMCFRAPKGEDKTGHRLKKSDVGQVRERERERRPERSVRRTEERDRGERDRER